MDFIDGFTLGMTVAVVLGFLLGTCCCCCRAIIPSSVVMAKWRREAALAGMEFDTCAAGEGGGGGCAICLNEYACGERRATISECNHRFHALCIETWMDYNSTCPLCRHNLV